MGTHGTKDVSEKCNSQVYSVIEIILLSASDTAIGRRLVVESEVSGNTSYPQTARQREGWDNG